jgi:hypothetical protein
MCDRVLVMYGGRIERELAGAAIDERAIVAASLHLAQPARHAVPAAAAERLA